MDWELVKACIILPFALAGRLVSFLFKNKILLIGVVILVFFVIGSRMLGGNNKAAAPTLQQVMTSTAPTIKQAPTMITTSTRQFYVKDYTDDGVILLLTKFYSYESSKWVYEQKFPLQIDRTVDKNIKVTKR